jgi:hypothetical protein
MKAITIMEPWATTVARWGKHVENRPQVWAYRGTLLIHAGQRWSDRGIHDRGVVTAALATLLDAGVRAVDIGTHQPAAALVRQAIVTYPGPTQGHVIAVAQLVDVHRDAGCCAPWGESAYTEHQGGSRVDVTHLVLDQVRPLHEPVRVRGALGLWTPPPHVIADVTAQLEELAAG